MKKFKSRGRFLIEILDRMYQKAFFWTQWYLKLWFWPINHTFKIVPETPLEGPKMASMPHCVCGGGNWFQQPCSLKNCPPAFVSQSLLGELSKTTPWLCSMLDLALKTAPLPLLAHLWIAPCFYLLVYAWLSFKELPFCLYQLCLLDLT